MSNDVTTHYRWLVRGWLVAYRYQTTDGMLRSKWRLKWVGRQLDYPTPIRMPELAAFVDDDHYPCSVVGCTNWAVIGETVESRGYRLWTYICGEHMKERRHRGD